MDSAFRAHWPLPSGLDFAKGPFLAVAAAVETEVRRFIRSEPLSKEARSMQSMAEVFGGPRMLDNVGLNYFIIPTRSEWTAIWTSTFLCSGYDSLSHCLTRHHGFATVHFTSSDAGGPFQPGTVLSYRSKDGERHVSAIQEDSRWLFHTSGTPLPEEDIARYEKKKITDRWNTEAILELLGRIGIRPWSEDFYDLTVPVVHLERRKPPSSILRITRDDFTSRHQPNKG